MKMQLMSLILAVLGLGDTTNPAPASSSNWLDDAPGGDLSLDALFPPEGTEPASQPTTTASAPPQAPPQAPPPPPQDFLRSADGSVVYKSREEAERGLAEKDRIIEQYRRTEIARTGIDPVTGRPAAQPAAQPQDQGYLSNPERYWDDLSKAAERGDKRAYAAITAQYQAEVQAQLLAPYLPFISTSAKSQAVEAVSNEIKEFRTFLGSKDFSEALDSVPVLKGAIQNAEQNPQLFGQLPELYKLVYQVSQARKLPELLKANSNPVPPTNPTPQPARPTASTSTMTPPTPSTGAFDMTSREGRAAYIKHMESGGVLDQKF